MTWIVMGVVTAAVTAFLVYTFYVRPRSYRSIGALDVPGEATIELPAGEVGVYYEDAQRWRYADRPQVANGFSMLVSDGEGDRLDLDEPETDMVYKSGGRNRIPYGTLHVPSAGTYNVISQINAAEVPPKARVTFGAPS